MTERLTPLTSTYGPVDSLTARDASVVTHAVRMMQTWGLWPFQPS